MGGILARALALFLRWLVVQWQKDLLLRRDERAESARRISGVVQDASDTVDRRALDDVRRRLRERAGR